MSDSSKKVLAIVANAPSPYRIYQHLRLVDELGDQVELWSLFLHEHNWQPWSGKLPEAIRPVVFGPGESVGRKLRLAPAWRDWKKMGRVIEWLDERQVDAVITTGYNSPGLLRLISHCHRAAIPNFLFGDSNVYSDRARGAARTFKKALVSWVLNRVTGLMTCGSYGKRFFDAYGGATKPCYFMPHEGDYRRIFSVGETQSVAVAKKFRLADGQRRIAFSGRLAPVKRVDTLIDAFVKVAAERNDWNLLIIGGGPLESELKSRVPANLQDRVEWTGFINDPDELAALYACGDVFVLPSSYEPWAVVVSEAASAGMAILASEVVGAAGELCRDGVNGRLFPPGDVDKLAAALNEVTGDAELLRQFRFGSLQVLDDWRRRGDPVQGVRLALASQNLLPEPPPVEPSPPTPTTPPRMRFCNDIAQ